MLMNPCCFYIQYGLYNVKYLLLIMFLYDCCCSVLVMRKLRACVAEQ